MGSPFGSLSTPPKKKQGSKEDRPQQKALPVKEERRDPLDEKTNKKQGKPSHKYLESPWPFGGDPIIFGNRQTPLMRG